MSIRIRLVLKMHTLSSLTNSTSLVAFVYALTKPVLLNHSWSILVANSKNQVESHKAYLRNLNGRYIVFFFFSNKLGAAIRNDGIIFYCRLKAKIFANTMQIENLLRN